MSPFKQLQKENERLRQLLLIKESDLDKLEEARTNLYKMFPNTIGTFVRFQHVTEIMWIIANSKKYRTGIVNDTI